MPRKKSVLTGWGLTTLSLLGLTSAMVLDVYLARGNVESEVLDVIKRLLFWGSSTEPVFHAPPLFNLSLLVTGILNSYQQFTVPAIAPLLYNVAIIGAAIFLAQIMGVVDVFDAITTERPYKMAASPGHAYEELTNEAKKGWRRKDLVEAFIALQEAGATV